MYTRAIHSRAIHSRAMHSRAAGMCTRNRRHRHQRLADWKSINCLMPELLVHLKSCAQAASPYAIRPLCPTCIEAHCCFVKVSGPLQGRQRAQLYSIDRCGAF